MDDFAHLRSDAGLVELIGHELPSPEAARKFLNAFHEEEKIEEAQQRRLPDALAYIPEESSALEGLGRVNRDLIQRLGERCADQKIFTVDQDATIIESRKREALYTYEGSRGYQPMLAVWAEMDVVLADEFRDGNVPAQMAPLTVAKGGACNGDELLLSGRLRLPREQVVALVVERETRRRAGRIHWFCGQRADE